jgi:hypothetical protein
MKTLFPRLILALSLAVSLPALAGSMSNYLENKVVDYIFRSQAWTQPSTLCVGLATAAPTDASTGATVTEAAYTGYARGQLNASYSAWKGTNDVVTNTGSAGTDGTTSNASAITLGAAATSGPTVVTHFFVADSCTAGAGNILFWSALTTSKTINNGDPAPSFAIDALTVQVDN